MDQPDYVFLSLPRSLLFFSPHPSPSLSLSVFSFRSLACSTFLSFFGCPLSAVSPSLLLYLYLSLSPSLSLSFLFSPHYPTHNRTPRERKTPAFAPHCSFGAYTRFQSAVCNLNIVCRKVCEKSYRDHSTSTLSSSLKRTRDSIGDVVVEILIILNQSFLIFSLILF